MTTSERTESSQVNLAIKNLANLDFNNDSYHVVGYVAKQYPQDVVNQSIDISLIGNDNLENSYARDAADLCYNRHLLYDGYKDMSMVGRFNGGADSYNHTAIRNVSAKTLARQARVSAYQVTIKKNDKNQSLGVVPVAVNNPDVNELTSFYTKKMKYANSRKKQEYSDLLSMALSDAAIRILENNLDCNDKAICSKANTESISNLSAQWKRHKRPQASDGVSVVYDNEGKEIDALSLVSMQSDDNNSFRKQALKVLTDDFKSVFLMYLDGYNQSEIAVELNKSERTIDRIFQSIKIKIAPIASELSDTIRRRDELPSYAW